MKQTAFSKGRQYLFTLGSLGPVNIPVLKHFTKVQCFLSTMTYWIVSPGYCRLSELYHSIKDAYLYTSLTDLINQSRCFSRLNSELKSRWQSQYFHLIYRGEWLPWMYFKYIKFFSKGVVWAVLKYWQHFFLKFFGSYSLAEFCLSCCIGQLDTWSFYIYNQRKKHKA